LSRTIPIVASTLVDPIGFGLAASHAQAAPVLQSIRAVFKDRTIGERPHVTFALLRRVAWGDVARALWPYLSQRWSFQCFADLNNWIWDEP
jgi:hypothetical protein